MSNKYSQGYIPKIQYWEEKWQEATKSNDELAAVEAAKKLNYFIGKQKELV